MSFKPVDETVGENQMGKILPGCCCVMNQKQKTNCHQPQEEVLRCSDDTSFCHETDQFTKIQGKPVFWHGMKIPVGFVNADIFLDEFHQVGVDTQFIIFHNQSRNLQTNEENRLRERTISVHSYKKARMKRNLQHDS